MEEQVEVTTKFHVRFYDKADQKWYTITKEPVSREAAESIWNDHTHHGQIYADPNSDDALYIEINPV